MVTEGPLTDLVPVDVDAGFPVAVLRSIAWTIAAPEAPLAPLAACAAATAGGDDAGSG